jgi:hypothetical protein
VAGAPPGAGLRAIAAVLRVLTFSSTGAGYKVEKGIALPLQPEQEKRRSLKEESFVYLL